MSVGTRARTVRVEVWPLVADEAGIWLADGHAWRATAPVPADGTPHGEVERQLAAHGVRGDTDLLHSTSWRVDGASVVLTYVAILRCAGPASRRWPGAWRVDARLADAAGRPTPTAATAAPAPRGVDVLLHAVRHLRFLLDTDATVAAALTGPWPRHLAALEPALAGMYDHR
jgi:hypothetical protein